MTVRPPEPNIATIPAPRLAITAWLLEPFKSIGPEGDAELRQTLVRRLAAVLISAAMMSSTCVLVAVRHPAPVFVSWVVLDLALASLRVPVILRIIHLLRCSDGPRDLPSEMVDLFVVVGTLWSAVVGFGMLACISTNDPALSMLASALALGTIGAQGVRSPGSPRLNTIQMCLVILPYAAGLLFSTIPLATWIAALIPFYLFGMIGITRQLHSDYVRLILARIENRRRALHCPLTQLPNRAFFHERLEAALKDVEGEGAAVNVLYLDLDGFKAINDTLGHGAGDDLLRQVADRLVAWMRPEAVVARLGGDEFAALTYGEPSEIETAVRLLIDRLGESYDLGTDGMARVGVSIGLAAGKPGVDSRAIMLQADQALYAAKRGGKGTYRWHRDIGAGADLAPDADLCNLLARMKHVSISLSPADAA